MAIDHDRIMEQLIQAFFREFLELFCPQEAAIIDFARVEFLLEEYFTDVGQGERRLLDLVAKVGLLAGGEECILIHGEFESSRKDRQFPATMFRRFCQLFLRYGLPVVPVAVFTDNARWRNPVTDSFEVQLTGQPIVRFRYHLVKLRQLDYRQFMASGNPLAYALMAKMDYNRQERAKYKAEFLRLILGAGTDPARSNLLVEFVETYMPLGPEHGQKFQQIVSIDPNYQKVDQMITSYEREGIKKGIKQGIDKGKQDTLILQLEKKFRQLSDAEKDRIRGIESTEELDRLLLAVIDAASLADLGIE